MNDPLLLHMSQPFLRLLDHSFAAASMNHVVDRVFLSSNPASRHRRV
jgi:hypothetical protein